MKKILSALVVALALVSTIGCGGSATTAAGTKK
jgi:predicted small lipoprotein YifL